MVSWYMSRMVVASTDTVPVSASAAPSSIPDQHRTHLIIQGKVGCEAFWRVSSDPHASFRSVVLNCHGHMPQQFLQLVPQGFTSWSCPFDSTTAWMMEQPAGQHATTHVQQGRWLPLIAEFVGRCRGNAQRREQSESFAALLNTFLTLGQEVSFWNLLATSENCWEPVRHARDVASVSYPSIMVIVY